MKTSELFAKMAKEMDNRWGELDLYRQELENLLRRAARAVETHQAERWHLLGGPFYEASLPQILHSMVWVFTTSFLETELRTFARALGNVLELSLSFGDLSGSWVDRFRKYVVELAELPLEISEQDWQDVKGVVTIRNCLVHNMGELQGFSKRLVIEDFCARNGEPKIHGNTLLLSDSSSITVMGIGGRILGESYDTVYQMFLKRENAR